MIAPTTTGTKPSAMPGLTATTMDRALLLTAASRGDDVAISTSDGIDTLTWREYADHAQRFAAGLESLGLAHGDTIAMLLTNRPEFHITDLAALLVGATPFSMYNTYPPEQLLHLLADTECRIVVTEPDLLPALRVACDLGADLDHIIVVGDATEGTTAWSALLEVGIRTDPSPSGPEDIATIIYTSGTTGAPKGVQLTHRNLIAMADSVLQVMPVDPSNRAISYLPMAHVAERVCSHYMPMLVGFSITCCSDPAEIADLLPRVRPHVFFSPPRVWEKLRAAVLANLEASGPELFELANAALEVGQRALRERQAGNQLSDWLNDQLQSTEPIRHAIRERLGLDQVAVGITGAAPCPPHVVEFFHALGVPLQEIYGLSETTGLITMTRSDELRLGTVGKVLPGMEIHMAEDGEIFARGPLVMAGYRNRPDATAEMIDSDGWLHTGDIGILDPDGSLRIVDRKKELIINAAGKNMSPANIEAKLKESSQLIGQAICIGDARPFNVALIVLDPAAARAFATHHRLPADDLAVLAESTLMQEELARCVERANTGLARVEQIKRFRILGSDWQPGGDELTPTMKLKRRPISDKYVAEIEALYAT
ncbi:MAG: AMP-dependent synthetase/ligase [Marmoricola sp.]